MEGLWNRLCSSASRFTGRARHTFRCREGVCVGRVEGIRLCADNRVRLLRVLLGAALYFYAAWQLIQLFGDPQIPARGHDVAAWDRGITMLSVFSSIAFTFYVVDASYLNSKIIHLLLKRDTHWPACAYDQLQTKLIAPAELAEYLDIRFIAMRTEVVGNVIYLPFIIYFLIIISRISLFDNWDWPVGLLIILASNVALALLAAILLRRARRGRGRRH